jgi:hypothetical protein
MNPTLHTPSLYFNAAGGRDAHLGDVSGRSHGGLGLRAEPAPTGGDAAGPETGGDMPLKFTQVLPAAGGATAHSNSNSGRPKRRRKRRRRRARRRRNTNT